MIKVLHVLNALGEGGVPSVIYNYYRCIAGEDVFFDFAVHTPEGMLENKFLSLNSKIFTITPKRKSILKNFLDLYRVIDSSKYDIIHAHLDSQCWIPLSIAMLKGIKIRIAGTHCANKLTLLQRFFRILTRIFKTNYCCCSKLAAQNTFGLKENDVFFEMLNVVDINRFLFRADQRKKIRSTYSINDDDILIGHIGRFVTEKNQQFLIDLLPDLLKRNPQIKLMLIGIGPLKEKCTILAEQLNCQSNIIWIDPQTEIEKFYNAFDLFVFPSVIEGFGMVAIEAQLNGLDIIVSDSLSLELRISENIFYCSLNDKEKWLELILQKSKQQSHQNDIIASKKNLFDATRQSRKLLDFYKKQYV